jgi:hypothetical protein
MPDSYVTSATITDGKIQLSVRVDDFKPDEDATAYIEISGQATQTGGAFANFYDIQQVPAKPNVLATDPSVTDGKDHYYVYVTGAPIPHPFWSREDVTVVMRVARVWLTVLGAKPEAEGHQSSGRAVEGTTWPKALRVAGIDGGSWTPGP